VISVVARGIGRHAYSGETSTCICGANDDLVRAAFRCGFILGQRHAAGQRLQLPFTDAEGKRFPIIYWDDEDGKPGSGPPRRIIDAAQLQWAVKDGRL
jgi:hypothetical protein